MRFSAGPQQHRFRRDESSTPFALKRPLFSGIFPRRLINALAIHISILGSEPRSGFHIAKLLTKIDERGTIYET
jgi:hypothetical protein